MAYQGQSVNAAAYLRLSEQRNNCGRGQRLHLCLKWRVIDLGENPWDDLPERRGYKVLREAMRR